MKPAHTDHVVVVHTVTLGTLQVPIVGTSGEQEFKVRQAKQMPVHDFDATMCDGTSNRPHHRTGLAGCQPTGLALALSLSKAHRGWHFLTTATAVPATMAFPRAHRGTNCRSDRGGNGRV